MLWLCPLSFVRVAYQRQFEFNNSVSWNYICKYNMLFDTNMYIHIFIIFMFGKSVLKIMNNCCMYPFLLFWSNEVFDLGIVINNLSQGFILLQRTVVTREVRLKLNFLGINPDIKPVYNSAILNLIYLQYDNRSAMCEIGQEWRWTQI